MTAPLNLTDRERLIKLLGMSAAITSVNEHPLPPSRIAWSSLRGSAGVT